MNADILSGLYAITDCELMPGEQLYKKSEAVLKAGCRLLQYRNKTDDIATRTKQAERLKRLCDQYGAKLFINDDVELAEQIDATGVHIGQTDLAIDKVKAQFTKQRIIGVSCHNELALAHQAERAGADYVAFGRFFDSHTKPHAPQASLDTLQQARQELSVPIVAIGGITRDNAPLALQRGAHMIAVIHDLFAVDDVNDVAAHAQELIQCFSNDEQR